ncbi:DKNYY domain-containing protein [Chitinophaga qingshengii]|uniref:DKNYY domain-containing protein n=1 Tax=Chitinophaga qingshengii TaxID=1569794 RepID=A0ABR7TSQ0_9BACT|nr:DKNYY domain-containing protein [Chitinophaga qingshengii]MBC9933033.1 DKNYY domain-containing protein [Chitinophaga qingshengii]
MWTQPAILPSLKDLPPGNNYYIIDGTKVCYNVYPIKNADRETFVCQLGFAKDKNNCYRLGEVYKGADPETFEVLNIYFAKDKQYIYNLAGIDKKVDYDTFTVLDTGYIIHTNNRQEKITSYAKDKNGLWMMEYYSQKPVAIKGIDTDTFTTIDTCYAKDKQYVLWRGKKLKKADPATFEALNFNYGRDARNIYAQDTVLANADYDTFEIVNNQVSLAKDKRAFYHFGETVSEEEFNEWMA